MKKRENKINKELSKIVEEEKEELLRIASTNAVEDTISSELERQIELSVGQAMAAEYSDIIIDGMEDVLASAVDEAVAEAVNQGISAAAAEEAVLKLSFVALLEELKSPSDIASIPAATRIASVPVPSSGA